MTTRRIVLAIACALLAVPASADEPKGKSPALDVEQEGGEPVIVHEGTASFYGGKFHGRKTASGERFDQNASTAASKELPLGSKATVTNEETGQSTDVIINDRGPYVKGRVIDLSKKAAEDIGITKEDGLAPVRVEVKPSEQPTDEAREKVEDKAEQTAERLGKPLPNESSGSSR
ncbi:MAG TPA: septal ring lytic transglycosylase RlpA family protein [Azospirillum sp.]